MQQLPLILSIAPDPRQPDRMAVVAVGHPARTDQSSERKDLKDLLLKEV